METFVFINSTLFGVFNRNSTVNDFKVRLSVNNGFNINNISLRENASSTTLMSISSGVDQETEIQSIQYDAIKIINNETGEVVREYPLIDSVDPE